MPPNSDLWAFGMLLNALRGGGDQDQDFPYSDADDLRNGAEWIPKAVTFARRAGEHVTFHREGPPNEWYWILPNGKTIRHRPPVDSEEPDGTTTTCSR